MADGLIGRDHDLRAVSELLNRHRLVTITGAAGIGKSALAAGLGANVCDLSPARSAEDIVAAVAPALQRGPTLIVLDGADHLVRELAPLVESWIVATPRSKFVVTTREALGLPDEHRYALSPLAVDDAIRLFEERAAHPGDCSLVREIVQRLDGLPLAIELCAARSGVLSLREILDRLERGEGLASLDAAIYASWKLLDSAEQSVLAALSVFEGPLPVEAAEAVIGGKRSATLEVIEALGKKSLIARSSDRGRTKLWLLRSVRQFASERLDDLEEREAAERRHAEWFVLHGELDRDLPDLVAAYRRMSGSEPVLAARLAMAVDRFRSIRGPGAGRREMLDFAVATLESAGETQLEIEARIERAELLRSNGDFDEAESDLSIARQKARAAGIKALEAEAVRQRADIEFSRGSRARALESATESVALHKNAGDPRLRGMAMATLGRALAWSGEREPARKALGRALSLHRRARDRQSEGVTLVRLANLTIGRAFDPRVDQLLSRALEIHAAAGDVRHEAHAWFILGLARHHRGALDQAMRAFERSCVMGSELGDASLEARAMTYLAVAALEAGDDARATNWADEALTLHEANGDSRYASFTRWCLGMFALRERELANARAHLGAALDAAADSDDDELLALYIASHAALEAEADHPKIGAELFARARRNKPATEEPYVRWFIDVLEGLLDLSRARCESKPAKAKALRERARLRLADVGRGEPPPTAYSSDVRLAARLLALALDRDTVIVREPSVLLIASDGRWFELAHEPRVDLSRRRALHHLVRRLAEARISTPGRLLSSQDLREAGWPGEKMLWTAARNRVYAAIRVLRELGLEGALLTESEGYCLDPSLTVRFAADSDAFR